MTIGKGKRPRDPSQHALWTVRVATGQIPAPEEKPQAPRKIIPPADLSQYMAAIGAKGGKKGGKARMESMTKGQRRTLAKAAASARWSKPKKMI